MRLTRYLKQLFPSRANEVSKVKIQFSPLEDITAYELARIIQIDNTAKRGIGKRSDYVRWITEYSVRRHFLVDGERMPLEEVQGRRDNSSSYLLRGDKQ